MLIRACMLNRSDTVYVVIRIFNCRVHMHVDDLGCNKWNTARNIFITCFSASEADITNDLLYNEMPRS